MKVREFLLKIEEFDLYAYDFLNSTSVPNVARHLNDDNFNFPDEYLNEGGVFVDIGGHSGLVSMVLSKKHPKSKFHIYECNPVMCECIKKALEKNNIKNIELHQIAVSTQSGEATFNFEENNSGGSGLHQGRFNKQPFKVKTEDFEFLFKNFESIDCMKMDIEGEEFGIFKKLIESKSNFFSKVKFLNIEFHDNQHYDLNLDGISRDIICEYLDSFDNLKYEISV